MNLTRTNTTPKLPPVAESLGKLDQETYTLELTGRDLFVLNVICRHIGGCPNGLRGVMDNLFNLIPEHINYFAASTHEKVLNPKVRPHIYFVDKIDF